MAITRKKRGNRQDAWQKLHGWEVYDNPWIRVEHHHVVTPQGTAGIYGLVHFKHHAVGIIPVDQEDHTWLVRQSRYPLDAYSWEIPEGGALLSDEPLAAAQRELEEETGLLARQWRELMRLHPSNSITDQSATLFVATDLYPGQQALEATEDIEVMRLPMADALTMVLKGEITDALSVAGLLRYAYQG